MTRSHFVKKARKAYPDDGIKKGEAYYWWKFRFGGMYRSKTLPKPHQLINSPFLSQMAEIEERIGAFTLEKGDAPESAIQEITSDLESLKDEVQGNLDNMPEQLQSDSIPQRRIDEIDSMISEFEQIDTDTEGMKKKEKAERFEEICSEVQNISYGGE